MVAYFMGSCDSGRIHVAPNEDLIELEGFVFVKAKGESVTLGKADSKAHPKERNPMKVEFSYNYYIGEQEITCSEFNLVMSRVGSTVPCEGERMPASLMNFNDVILFANTLSKRDGFDTVYSYYSAKFDINYHCIELEGLKVNYDVEGYRLPTEAEWVYASKPGWNVKHAWSSEISDYETHFTCVQPRNYLGLCDMEGNVMEWVDGWLGYFKDTTVTNYVGATDGGTLGERIVKGGSFRNEAQSISNHSRLDVYAITSISRYDYLGFRLAFGKIPDPVRLSSDGSAAESNLTVGSGASSVKELTGSFLTKLVFRNDLTGNLAYIDYSSGNLAIKEIADTINAYHPDISPDGKLVAFCTMPEGQMGTSELYVRKLNSAGDGLVKLDVESAAIPRWRVLPNGDTVIVYVSDAGENNDLAIFKEMSTWQVPFANGKFGEPVKLFDGAYHDGISSDNSLAVSGARTLRARVAENGSTVMESASDKLWYDEKQACNASLSKGSSKQTLFLEFGGEPGRDFVGSKFAAHEYLFVADEDGSLKQAIHAPKGYTFDHTEWVVGDTTKVSKESGILTATLTNRNGAHSKIILMDTKDSSYITLVDGDELWHPCVWIKQNILATEDVFLAVDSAGVYHDFISETSEKIMKVKMRMFWDTKDSMELYAMGSSRTERGFYPAYLTSYKSFNFGFSGSELWSELYLAKNYVLNHAKNLKVLLIELSPDLQGNSPEFMDLMVFKQAPGYEYDKNHDFWKDGLPEYFVSFVDEYLGYSEEDEENYVETMGLLRTEAGGWKGNEVDKDSLFDDEEREYYDAVMDSLDAFIKRTSDLGIKIILPIFPQSSGYAKTGAFGRHGVQKSLAKETIAHFQEMSKKYPHLVVMDEYNFGDHDYTDDLALDYDHLCTEGAIHFTERLDSLLKSLD